MAKPKPSVEKRKLLNLIRKANSEIKKAIKPIGADIAKKVKANTPKDTGALKKSITKKQVAKSGKSAAVIVGPKTNFEFVDKDGQVHKPSQYAHLAEAKTHFMSKVLTQAELTKLKQAVAQAIKNAMK